jgi:hypothetical protein
VIIFSDDMKDIFAATCLPPPSNLVVTDGALKNFRQPTHPHPTTISRFIFTDDVILQLCEIKFIMDRPPGAVPLVQLGPVNVHHESLQLGTRRRLN